MGTRNIDPQQLIFDHAAQFFTVSDPEFSGLVDLWAEKGLVREWQGIVGELEAGGIFTPLPNSPPRYVGVNGMRPLADSVLSEVVNVCFCIISFFMLLLLVETRTNILLDIYPLLCLYVFLNILE